MGAAVSKRKKGTHNTHIGSSPSSRNAKGVKTKTTAKSEQPLKPLDSIITTEQYKTCILFLFTPVFPSDISRIIVSLLVASCPCPPATITKKALTAKALYAFDAENEDELSFTEDQILIIVSQLEDWWLAKLENESKPGLIPSNYVEPIEYETKTELEVTTRREIVMQTIFKSYREIRRGPTLSQPKSINFDIHVKTLALVHISLPVPADLAQFIMEGIFKVLFEKFPPVYDKPMALALYDYTGADDAELTFKEGELLEIVEQDPSGWWLALKIVGEKSEGYIPGNYFQVLQNDPKDRACKLEQFMPWYLNWVAHLREGNKLIEKKQLPQPKKHKTRG